MTSSVPQTDSRMELVATPAATDADAYQETPQKVRFEKLEKCGFYGPRWFLVFLSVYVVLQSAVVTGFTSSVLSTLETRYDLSSKKTGLIAACYDISVTLVVVGIGYVGGKGIRKPRALAIGLMLMSLGSLLFAFPHFVGSAWEPNPDAVSTTNTCEPDDPPYEEVSTGSDSHLYFLFILGQLAIGVGAAPLYVLGPSFLDENIGDTQLPLYLSIFYAMGAIGPAIGFIIGGVFLGFPVNSDYAGDLTSEDPEWVGAWWMGFVFTFVVGLAFCVPLFLYPRYLPGTTHIRRRKAESEAVVASKFGASTEFLPSIKALLTNKVYMCVCLGTAAELTTASAFAAFLPKMVQSGFGLTAGKAAITVGGVVVPGAAGGIFVGGFIVKRMKLSCVHTARLSFIISFLAVLSTFVMLVGCPTAEIAGVTVPYKGQMLHPERDGNCALNNTVVDSPCNAGCSCNPNHYAPVCGVDDMTYLNGCYAGCLEIVEKNGAGVDLLAAAYDQCECVYEEQFSYPHTAKEGVCDTGCGAFLPFLAGLFVLMFLTFSNNVPATTVTLRSIHLAHRPMGLGLQSVTYRLLGSIPGPIIFGALVDNTCLFWDHEEYEAGSCKEGNCWVYDQTKLRLVFALFGLTFKGISSLFFFLAWRIYAAGGYQDSDEEEKAVAMPSGFELDEGAEVIAARAASVENLDEI